MGAVIYDHCFNYGEIISKNDRKCGVFLIRDYEDGVLIDKIETPTNSFDLIKQLESTILQLLDKNNLILSGNELYSDGSYTSVVEMNLLGKIYNKYLNDI